MNPGFKAENVLRSLHFGNATVIFPNRDKQAITFLVFLVTFGGTVGTFLDYPKFPVRSDHQNLSLNAYSSGNDCRGGHP
jgi:hypothetical protein